MVHRIDYPGGNRGDCHHRFRRNPADERGMGGMMGGMMNCYGGMAGAWLFGLLLIAVCGHSHLALTAQIGALSRIEAYEQQLTDERLHSA